MVVEIIKKAGTANLQTLCKGWKFDASRIIWKQFSERNKKNVQWYFVHWTDQPPAGFPLRILLNFKSCLMCPAEVECWHSSIQFIVQTPKHQLSILVVPRTLQISTNGTTVLWHNYLHASAVNGNYTSSDNEPFPCSNIPPGWLVKDR